MGGRIELLNVKEGDRVRKGQLLMKLWNDDQQAQQTLATAQMDTARKRVVEACTAADTAVREAKRQTELRAQGFVSVSREDAARSEADTRSAACQTARSDVVSAQARIGATLVEQGRTRLVAPFDGRVAKIVGEVGEYSTPSPPGVQTPPAIDLIDDSCLYIKAPMDEVDAPRILPGQPVPPPPVVVRVWVAPSGKIDRVAFDSLGDAQADTDLRTLLTTQPLAEPPPRDMRQPMVLQLSLGAT